jgi:hypothetical protein
MRRWFLAALLLSVALLRPAPAAAQAPDAKPDLAANAALKYWKAFALMPALDKEQETLLGDWNKVPLDAAAQKLITESEKSRLYLYRGAKLPRCDWGLNWEDGMELLLPYLAKSRDLARLAALHGRYEFSRGNWDAGAEDAIAMMALARHVGSEPIMLCILVRYLIETITLDLLAPYLPELKAQSPKIIAAYEALPAGATLPQAFQTEKKHMLQWLVREMKQAEEKKPGAWRAILKRAAGLEGDDVVNQVGTFDRAIALTEATVPVSDELAKFVVMPREEFEAKYPEFKKKVKAENLLASHLLSSVEKMLAAQHRNQTQIALLRAAVAVVRDGPDKIKDSKDPFGDGPFEYRARDKGFELKSKLLYKGQPVMLIVGEGKKS